MSSGSLSRSPSSPQALLTVPTASQQERIDKLHDLVDTYMRKVCAVHGALPRCTLD